MTRRDSDEQARARIRTDLSANMLVEAGAGSGKTTLLVERMVEHVRVGTPVERLAAVTFTRKAANELRERFQIALEGAARTAAAGDERVRYARALRELDRAFLGTIHAFCGRLLREHPIQIGLDPNFQEVTEEDAPELLERFWRGWLERARRDGNADLVALAAVGLDPAELEAGFATVVRYPDVEFPVGNAGLPDVAPCRAQLARLLAAAQRLIPATEPADGWDPLMKLVRRLEYRRKVTDWSDVAQFCAALETVAAAQTKAIQRRWADDKQGKAEAKALAESWLALVENEAAELLRCWRERRYPIVMRLLQAAARDFERARYHTGQLTFEDLLLLAARMLRERPEVRDVLGARYAHLFVDEFQDTDPMQAEVCFLLASPSVQGNDWRIVTPRAGSLFVVGDPKQSIYRFRRADIQVYEFVKQRLSECGVVLALTRNFRSVSSIEAVVNGYFEEVFPAVATAEQAAYSPMETQQEPEGSDGVYRYCLEMDGTHKGSSTATLDANAVAGWIHGRIASGTRRPGDFLILTPDRKHIAQYARALAARNVPAATTGAPLPQEYELRELLLLLRAIADPENAVLVAAVLEGLFFGLSPADLWRGAQTGLRFVATQPPENTTSPMGVALRQLHDWWTSSQLHSADILLGQIMDETGLLYHAASADLGEARAGALLHLVASVRAAAANGDATLTDAMRRLDQLLAADAPDAPLRAGRTDVVRIMNLHKAKGLEADVVILAAPIDRREHEPVVHVTRDAAGRATGGLIIASADRVLAQPPGWQRMQESEDGFARAERERLLYVAATRAKRELVVAQCRTNFKKEPRLDTSPWRPLAGVLEEHSLVLPLASMGPGAPQGRRTADVSPRALQQASARAAEAVVAAAIPSFTVSTVTRRAKHAEPEPRESLYASAAIDNAPGGAGVVWGRAVHEALEGLGRGRRGPALDAYVRAVARVHQLDDERTTALGAIIAEVEASAEWRQLVTTGPVMVEVPVMQRNVVDGIEEIIEGVVDAAALGPDGWFVVDWKSDAVSDAVWEQRRPAYERQVAQYAEMLTAMTGKPARGVIKRLDSAAAPSVGSA